MKVSEQLLLIVPLTEGRNHNERRGNPRSWIQEAVAAEAAPVSFHETLEEGLRNEPSLRAIKDVNGLAKGYVNAQRMIGADKTVIPASLRQQMIGVHSIRGQARRQR